MWTEHRWSTELCHESRRIFVCACSKAVTVLPYFSGAPSSRPASAPPKTAGRGALGPGAARGAGHTQARPVSSKSSGIQAMIDILSRAPVSDPTEPALTTSSVASRSWGGLPRRCMGARQVDAAAGWLLRRSRTSNASADAPAPASWRRILPPFATVTAGWVRRFIAYGHAAMAVEQERSPHVSYDTTLRCQSHTDMAGAVPSAR